jgi:hypothetical protein
MAEKVHREGYFKFENNELCLYSSIFAMRTRNLENYKQKGTSYSQSQTKSLYLDSFSLVFSDVL